MKKATMKLTKVSKYSYGVVIPKKFIKNLKWKEKQKVDVILSGKNLTIKDWKKPARLA